MKFVKRFIHIPNAPSIPAIQLDEPETVVVETTMGRRIPSQFANLISLREPNPNGENAGRPAYLRVTRENLGFTTLRFSDVEGLDVDEAGHPISLRQLEERRGAEIAARQAELVAQRATAEVDFDLDADDVTANALLATVEPATE